MIQATVLGGALLQTHFLALVLWDGLATLFRLGRVLQRVGNEVETALLHRLELLLAVQTEVLVREVVALAALLLQGLRAEFGLVLHLPLTVTLFSGHGLAALLEETGLLLDVQEGVGTTRLDVGGTDSGAVRTTPLVGDTAVHLLHLVTTLGALLLIKEFHVVQHVVTGTLVLILVLLFLATSVDDLVGVQHGTLLEREFTAIVFLLEHVVRVLVRVDTEFLPLLSLAELVALVLFLVAVHAPLVQLETDLGAVLGAQARVELGGTVHDLESDVDQHQELGHRSTGQSQGHQGEESH